MGVSDPPTYLNQALHYDISIRSRWLANINITPSYLPHLFNAIPKLWKLNSALLCLCNLFQRKVDVYHNLCGESYIFPFLVPFIFETFWFSHPVLRDGFYYC